MFDPKTGQRVPPLPRHVRQGFARAMLMIARDEVPEESEPLMGDLFDYREARRAGRHDFPPVKKAAGSDPTP